MLAPVLVTKWAIRARRHVPIHDGSVADSGVDADVSQAVVERWSYGRRSSDPLFCRRRPHVRWEPDSPTARSCSESRQTVSLTVMPTNQLNTPRRQDVLHDDSGPASR